MNTRVLVSSLTPASGGVSTMARFVLDTLRKGGAETILAHYEPYGMTAHLSTPLFALGLRKPGVEQRMAYGEIETHAIGAWLPELEFTHFRPTSAWCSLMERCDRFVSVSGNVLAASPFALSGRPFLAWVATGWKEDRVDRVKQFPAYRKLLDRLFNARVLQNQERKVLKSGRILALSHRTQHVLDQIAGQPVVADVLPMPIDGSRFQPNPYSLGKTRIGFIGRFNDPRKNIDLLLDAFARVLSRGVEAELVLIGAEPTANLEKKLCKLAIEHSVKVAGFVDRAELVEVLQSLSVFVVPSKQEGLCIAALEAMACGCPVVSTRCGGPEEFVLEGETGYLVNHDAAEMADAITRVVNNRAMRNRLGKSARQLVIERYNRDLCENIFWRAFDHNAVVSGEVAA